MNKATGTTHVPLDDVEERDDGKNDHASAEEQELQKEGPNLHMMGTLFLGKVSRYVFDFAVLLHLYVCF